MTVYLNHAQTLTSSGLLIGNLTWDSIPPQGSELKITFEGSAPTSQSFVFNDGESGIYTNLKSKGTDWNSYEHTFVFNGSSTSRYVYLYNMPFSGTTMSVRNVVISGESSSIPKPNPEPETPTIPSGDRVNYIKANAVYYGTSKVDRLYWGSHLVFETEKQQTSYKKFETFLAYGSNGDYLFLEPYELSRDITASNIHKVVVGQYGEIDGSEVERVQYNVFGSGMITFKSSMRKYLNSSNVPRDTPITIYYT